MTNWTKGELSKIATTDDFHIAPFREDGATYGTPTWIWSVVVEDALYVRAYNGVASRWYKSAMQQKAGRVTAGGLSRQVVFAKAGEDKSDLIDDAYRQKYGSSSYLGAMIGARARAATVRVDPRTDKETLP